MGAMLDILTETLASFTDKYDCFEIHFLISTGPSGTCLWHSYGFTICSNWPVDV